MGKKVYERLLKDFQKFQKDNPNYVPVAVPTIPQVCMTRRIVGLYTMDDKEDHKHVDDNIGLTGDWRKRYPVYVIPFRTLYGKDIKNLITAGRCISVTDAMWDITRVIPTCAVTGEAAVTAAAMNYQSNRRDVPKSLTLGFEMPIVDMFSTWNPLCGFKRGLYDEWSPITAESRAAFGAPVQSLISKSGKNRLTIAVSDFTSPIEIKTGVRENNAELQCEIGFFTKRTNKIDKYEAVIRIDTRDTPYYDSIYAVQAWWSAFQKHPNAHVPECARLPVYSTWYSFHQHFGAEEILRQCRLSKELGCHSVIVDDGWQTDDIDKGYSYCGDWEAAKSKIPDMRELVKEVHALGMKYMLWYSVPFVGKNSKAWNLFYGKFLDVPQRDWRVLDPRFKDVRDYLVNIYEKAVSDWDLDGLKLDFIDSFSLTDFSSPSEEDGRDFDSVDQAVEELLNAVLSRLRALKPDICIEFRQSYIGPAMQSYGNMLRVGDCPNDSLRNRIGSINLRLTSGKTPVHSDMLMWNYSDTVESAALQIINILYTVPQISVLIDKLSPDHHMMLKFYLNFWCNNREILLYGRLEPLNPEANYSIVTAEKNGKMIAAAYSKTILNITDAATKEIVFVNGTGEDVLFIKSEVDFGIKKYTVLDCMGNTIKQEVSEISSTVAAFEVPSSGMICIS